MCACLSRHIHSLVMLATGVCWSLYGLLVIDDMSVYLPNLLGVLLALVQLSLFGVYGFSPSKPGSGLASAADRDRDLLPYSVLKLED